MEAIPSGKSSLSPSLKKDLLNVFSFAIFQKGEAIARSSFSEVLYMDSDNIAVRDPTVSRLPNFRRLSEN